MFQIYSLVGDKETGAPPSREVINTRVEMVAKVTLVSFNAWTLICFLEVWSACRSLSWRNHLRAVPGSLFEGCGDLSGTAGYGGWGLTERL